ncbi:hypothetical protein AVEN_229845-1 [Araneus ventricosus]|uniref:RNase H type-1 domain-containing protein n=1 Tax=Araneus ventricosus TaxID=182803 RepID=A0A4Y2S074_ARAVE|nr:hypothetical protein AVEN_229845-1 [Araneus ventricosus]
MQLNLVKSHVSFRNEADDNLVKQATKKGLTHLQAEMSSEKMLIASLNKWQQDWDSGLWQSIFNILLSHSNPSFMVKRIHPLRYRPCPFRSCRIDSGFIIRYLHMWGKGKPSTTELIVT